MRVELLLMRFVPHFMWFVLVLLRVVLVLLRFVLLCHEGRTSFLCSTCTFSFQLVIETPKFVLHSEQLRSLVKSDGWGGGGREEKGESESNG